jgi:CheY-like chemotaxis protein
VGDSARKFLVIDDNVENRFLLSRTIQRKYPHASVVECGELATAIEIAGHRDVDAVVSHRAGEVDGIELVRELRRANATVPIVMVSGYDRTRAALAAGATRFLNYDEWLRLGSVIDEIFATQPWAAVVGALTYAIHGRIVMTLAYQGDAGVSHQLVEPHLLGVTADGQFVLRAQTAGRGQHSGFGWETYLIPQIKDFAFTERTFAPHDAAATNDRQIARVLCQA